jgi:hypothetical protein
MTHLFLEEPVSEDNAAPTTDTTQYQEPGLVTTILAAVVIGVAIVAALAAYKIHNHDLIAAQAASWARTFIRSSPVVERQLGSVQHIKRIKEEHVSGKAPGWYLDYDVTGRHGMGVVEMRMTRIQYDDWNFPSAELNEGHRKPVNLR